MKIAGIDAVGCRRISACVYRQHRSEPELYESIAEISARSARHINARILRDTERATSGEGAEPTMQNKKKTYTGDIYVTPTKYTLL